MKGEQEHLEHLIARHYTDKRCFDVVSFVHDFLVCVNDLGAIRCEYENKDSVNVSVAPQDSDILVCVPFSALAFLRSVCARLAMICSEATSGEFLPYGNEVDFPYEIAPGVVVPFHLKFLNTSGIQFLELASLSRHNSSIVDK